MYPIVQKTIDFSSAAEMIMFAELYIRDAVDIIHAAVTSARRLPRELTKGK